MLVVCASATIDRVHGFLRSCMLNPHPGVYVSVSLDAGSRDRIWDILRGWWEAEPAGTILMMYRDKSRPMGVAFRSLGAPRRTIVEHDGVWMLLRKAETCDNDPSENP